MSEMNETAQQRIEELESEVASLSESKLDLEHQIVGLKAQIMQQRELVTCEWEAA